MKRFLQLSYAFRLVWQGGRKWCLASLALAGAALGLPPGALAQATPAGLWKTIDDDGKTEKSLVRITEAGGVFSAKIEKIFDPAKQDARCEKCSDERKDQPVVGLSIVRGVKASPSDPALWDGGEILESRPSREFFAAPEHPRTRAFLENML